MLSPKDNFYFDRVAVNFIRKFRSRFYFFFGNRTEFYPPTTNEVVLSILPEATCT